MRETPARQIPFIAKTGVPPRSAAKVRNGPRPAKRAAAEATVWALDSWRLHICTFTAWSSAQTVASPPPGARSSRPVPHAPPALARSGHPVVCHAARNLALSCVAPVARRAARQPTAWPSARPAGAVAAHTREAARVAVKPHVRSN